MSAWYLNNEFTNYLANHNARFNRNGDSVIINGVGVDKVAKHMIYISLKH